MSADLFTVDYRPASDDVVVFGVAGETFELTVEQSRLVAAVLRAVAAEMRSATVKAIEAGRYDGRLDEITAAVRARRAAAGTGAEVAG